MNGTVLSAPESIPVMPIAMTRRRNAAAAVTAESAVPFFIRFCSRVS
ncbi:MAG: hypothetical protein IJM21_00675 [Clostridia bacterium]|nr:hypothetical protein [Clostridia bacterium]